MGSPPNRPCTCCHPKPLGLNHTVTLEVHLFTAGDTPSCFAPGHGQFPCSDSVVSGGSGAPPLNDTQVRASRVDYAPRLTRENVFVSKFLGNILVFEAKSAEHRLLPRSEPVWGKVHSPVPYKYGCCLVPTKIWHYSRGSAVLPLPIAKRTKRPWLSCTLLLSGLATSGTCVPCRKTDIGRRSGSTRLMFRSELPAALFSASS